MGTPFKLYLILCCIGIGIAAIGFRRGIIERRIDVAEGTREGGWAVFNGIIIVVVGLASPG